MSLFVDLWDFFGQLILPLCCTMKPKIDLKVTKIAQLEGHLDAVYALSESDERGVFFSAGADGFIARWQTNALKDAQLIVKISASVYCFQYIKDLNLMAIAQRNGGVHLVDLNLKREINLFQVSQQAVFALTYNTATKILYAGDQNGVLTQIDLEYFKIVGQQKISEKAIRSLDLNIESTVLAVGCSDGCIYLVDVGSHKIDATLAAHGSSVFAVRHSPCGGFLVSGSRDAHLNIWTIVDGKYALKTSIGAHLFTINCIRFCPNKLLLATASRDKTIKIWDTNTFELLKVIDFERYQSHRHSVNTLIWTNDYLLSAGDDKRINVFEIDFES